MPDPTNEMSTAEAARLLRIHPKTVLFYWRAGILKGRMAKTINGHNSRLWLKRESIDAYLADQERSPLDAARRNLPTGFGSRGRKL